MPKQEVRAVWITVLSRLDWPQTRATSAATIAQQKAELCQQLDQLKAANFNTVLMQTRVRGDLIYPSAYEPFSEALTGTQGRDPGYDVLKFAVDECHKRGMECHAWVVAIPIGNNQHVQAQGKQSVVKKHPELCIKHGNFWYLNPGHPGTKEYLLKICQEMADKYDIDGISFDYIRYPDGKLRFPDHATYRRYGKGLSLADWRRENLTELVRYIYKGVKKDHPYLKVGSSPLGKYRDTNRYPSRGWNAYHTVFQDAGAWLEEGIQDLVFPMLYFRENNFYPFVMDWKERSHGRMVVPGLGAYFLEEASWPLSDIEEQIYFTRSAEVPGQAYFRAKFVLRNVSGIYDHLKKEAYPYPALLPPMSWQDSIAPSVPQGLQTQLEGNELVVSWKASTDNNRRSKEDSGVRYVVYASPTQPVDTHNPRNIRAMYLKECRWSMPAQEASGLHFAVTAVDCYGNESEGQDPITTLRTESRRHASPHVLKVGEISGAVTLRLCDLYGRELQKQAFQPMVHFQKLEEGTYRWEALDSNGRILKSDLFVKGE
jgi:uncharacterized lipoprotein YddW (UPF0748 family)